MCVHVSSMSLNLSIFPQEILERRRTLFKEFDEILKRLNALHDSAKEQRVYLRGGEDFLLILLC